MLSALGGGGKGAAGGTPGKPRRLLHVDVVEARNLSSPSGHGTKSPDALQPFVRVQLLDIADRPKKTETFETGVVKETNAPKFGQRFEIGNSFDLNVDELPSVQFIVLHKASMFNLGVVPDIVLGQVTVALSPLSSGEEIETWYSLVAGTGVVAAGAGGAGELKIRLRLDARITAPVPSGDVVDVENPETVDLPPNQLKVVVIQGKNFVDKGSTAFVQLKVSGTSSDGPDFAKFTTQPVKASQHQPTIEWNQSFSWDFVKSSSMSLKVTLKNKGLLGTESKLGAVVIPIGDFRDKKSSRKWFKILGVEGVQSGQVRGEIELQIHWRTSLEVLNKENEKAAKSAAASSGGLRGLFGVGKSVVLDDDDEADFGGQASGDDDDDDEAGGVPIESPEQVEARKKAEGETMNRLQDISVQSGDYQIQVHIIEARDLKGENEDTTSNPMVSIECFGQKQHTRVVQQVNSCVFDELLIFNIKNLDKDQFAQGVVRVACKSVPKMGAVQYSSSKMIGAYAFDACGIYQSNKDHELYRQWVALMDDVDESDVGVQGYLKLSVIILGPGDKLKIHDEEKELLAEQQSEIAAGGDISSMVLSVPVIRKEWKYIVATIYKAEGLPVMDGKTGIGSLGTKAKTDAVVKVQMAGAKMFKSQTVTVEGETASAINPQFFCEIWYPVSIPSSSNIVKLSVWDKDIGTYELIGNIMEKFDRIKKGHGPERYIADDLKWYNIYGAPENKTETIVGNVKKLAAATRKAVKMAGGEADWKKWYNNVPERAPCYKGRLLASLRIEGKRPPKFETPEVKPFLRSLCTRKMSKEVIDDQVFKMESLRIPQESYSLHALVICGSDLPQFSNLGGTQKLRVSISIGISPPLITKDEKCELGSCRWNTKLSRDDIKLPKDLSQVPDIFIYLLKEDNKAVSFTRIKCSDLMGPGAPAAKPEFYTMRDILLFLDNHQKPYQEYAKFAADASLVVIREDDTSDLLGYLQGKIETCRQLDSATVGPENPLSSLRTCVMENSPIERSDGMVVLLGKSFPEKSFSSFRRTPPNPFLNPAKWFLLEEDKSIDCLDQDDFPGTVLIKLGFGPTKLATQKGVKEEWYRVERVSKEQTTYQLRLHIFQGGELPSADSNGLCDPFLNVFFMGKKKKSKTVYKSLYPNYYQTLVFDEVNACGHDNFQYASQITVRLFDADDIGSEYLGMLTLPLSDAFVTNDFNIAGKDLPDPKWYNFFIEKPGDGQGKLLVLAQLIPTHGKHIPVPDFDKLDDKSKHLSIVPESRDCYIEIVAIGLRNLAPYRFQAMQNPFMEISLQSLGTIYDAKTRTSKLPSPSNPNFLEVIKMAVKLPVKSIFAPPINIRVSDTRLGGYSKPVVGVGSIDLRSKIPWCPETYVAPGKDLFVENIQTSAVAAQIRSLTHQQSSSDHLDAAQKLKLDLAKKREEDDFIVSPQAPNVDEILARKIADLDTGAGVFGAMTHIKVKDGRSKKSKAEQAFATDLDYTEDDSELPPAWMLGRKKLESDLETEMQSSPFETYNLIRGKIHGFLGSSVKIVGKFKGLIRVTEDISTPMLPKEVMDSLLRPRPYKIRLYVLRASGLAKKDFNLDGSPAASDPYLKVKLGNIVFNDRENAVNDVTDCDLYKMVEMDAELPGSSQLLVDIMDKDFIGSDDLIGSTLIDLEDRLFDGRWQQLGRENMISTGDDANDKNRVRWATKPIERRNLTAPGTGQPQGTLECFLDIMRPEEAIIFPPEDVSLPPKQLFELRIIVWNAKDVPPMDSFEGMSDLFVKIIPEGCAPQETDTHWRAKKGKASWNWRLLFDIELGHNSRAMKFPHLRFQLWDRDILKWNDCAGETVIDMGKFYRKAFKKNVAIKLFEKKQGASALRAKRAEALKPSKVLDTGDADLPPAEKPSTVAATEISAGSGKAAPVDDPASPTTLPVPLVPEEEKKEDEDEETPLLKGQDEENDDFGEMREHVNNFKSMTGLWPDIDPPDSDWIKIGKKDHNTDKFEPMGAICVSIQIWPKPKAIVMPVGAARNEPNTNPFLPPPVGRLKFSWNPFVLGTELCGPKICGSITCICLCTAFIVLMIFCQPFLNIIINLVFVVCGA